LREKQILMRGVAASSLAVPDYALSKIGKVQDYAFDLSRARWFHS